MFCPKFIFRLTLLLLFFLPVLSFAVQLGPKCSPNEDVNQDQYCRFCASGESNEELGFGWKVPGVDQSKSVCFLTCTRSDGLNCTVFREQGGYAVNDYNPNLSDPWDNFNLKPVSAIKIKATTTTNRAVGLATGNVYQMSCCERSSSPNPGLFNICKAGTSKSSKKITITGCGAACELPFSSTRQAFLGSNPFHITEKSLSDWVITQDLDNVIKTNGLGSGDVRDVEGLIIENQCSFVKCLLNNSCPKPVYFNSRFDYLAMPASYKESIDTAVENINNNFPLRLSLRGQEWPVALGNNVLTLTGHAVIVVGYYARTSGYTEPVYDFDIIDPNIPDRVTSLKDCRYGEMITRSSGLTETDRGLICNPIYPSSGKVIIGNWSVLRDLAQKWVNFCSNSQNVLNYKDLCNRKPLEWLKNNLTNFVNPGAGGGNCYAWTNFFLKSAYLGDFVGTDYHPGDGKTVGTDCDQNRYPLKTSQNNPTSWLASLYSTLGIK